MSGEKISRTEINRRNIQALNQQMDQMARNYQRALQETDRRRQNDIHNLSERNRLREVDLQRKISGLNSDIHRAAEEYRSEIRKQSKAFYESQKENVEKFNNKLAEQNKKDIAARNQLEGKLNKRIDNVLSMAGSAIEETNKKMDFYRKSQQEQLDKTNGRIDILDSSVDQLLNNQQQQDALAVSMRQALQEELSLVQSLPYQKFASEEMDKVLNQITNIPADKSTQITVAHTSIRELLRLESVIEDRRLNYEQIHLIALQAAEALLETMNNNRTGTFFVDESGEAYVDETGNKIIVELDFWTNGEYSTLQKRVEEIAQTVRNNIDTPNFSLENLQELLDELDQLQQQQTSLVIEAIEKGNAAQIRAEMADLVQLSLEENNYTIVSRGYEQEDQRKSYLVKMHNPHNQSDVVILIYPESVDSHQLIVKTEPGGNGYLDEKTAMERAKAINQSLRENSIHVSSECKEVQQGNSHALDELYDVDAILDKKGRGIPQSVIERAKLKQANN